MSDKKYVKETFKKLRKIYNTWTWTTLHSTYVRTYIQRINIDLYVYIVDLKGKNKIRFYLINFIKNYYKLRLLG